MMQFVRTLTLIAACLSLVIVLGGAVYEHLAVVPGWTAAVPRSLSMFQGEYALAAFRFWIPTHPVTMVLLITALALNWATERRGFILAAIAGYALVLVATFVFFVPELLALMSTFYSASVDAELMRRANLWEALSLARLAMMVMLSGILLFGLSKSGKLLTKAA